jgi:hypothetical protein
MISLGSPVQVGLKHRLIRRAIKKCNGLPAVSKGPDIETANSGPD